VENGRPVRWVPLKKKDMRTCPNSDRTGGVTGETNGRDWITGFSMCRTCASKRGTGCERDMFAIFSTMIQVREI